MFIQMLTILEIHYVKTVKMNVTKKRNIIIMTISLLTGQFGTLPAWDKDQIMEARALPTLLLLFLGTIHHMLLYKACLVRKK